MSHSEHARSPARRRRPSTTLAAVVVVSTTLVGVVGCQPHDQSPTPSYPSTASPPPTPSIDHHAPPDQREGAHQRHLPISTPTTPRSAVLGVMDGALPDGVTVFDGEYPGIANLDPDLLRALREAARAAADDGVAFVVNSGWRSPEYQDQLLREAMSDYGSEDEAAQWVATPDTSFHVTGDAVDLDTAARAWLSEHGRPYGLCQIYDNEPWHYELRPDAIDQGCPAMYPDPSHDPRMQQ